MDIGNDPNKERHALARHIARFFNQAGEKIGPCACLGIRKCGEIRCYYWWDDFLSYTPEQIREMVSQYNNCQSPRIQENNEAISYLRQLAFDLETAPRCGGLRDEPEGAMFVILSNTFAWKAATRLRGIIDELVS